MDDAARPSLLGDILCEMGRLDRAQLALTLEAQRDQGRPLGRMLVEEQLCSEADVLHALAAQSGLATIDLAEQPLDRGLTSLIPAELARQHRVLPLRVEPGDRGVLHVAVGAPAALDALDAVRAVSGHERLAAFLVPDGALELALDQLYGLAPTATPVGRPGPILLYAWPHVTAAMLTKALRQRGYPAKVASALDVTRSVAGDVVVAPLAALDGLLPKGASLAGHTVVVADPSDEELERARRVGAQGFLSPPLDVELLERVLHRFRAPSPLDV